ncbi:ABC transporter ATP-binding protein [Halostella sp. JP-L12]|uniref:ABC transporter ATP-binding protein n=1 Tax=Halostella TaxID=1843185 RepID=UPI000EF7AAD2|nr:MULTISPECIES: ABC transporter ATP-binding protein [Halostella]NHN46919.1 ABC transporter ATP-binding protein [Halostella sp. JP-L12]
MDQLDTERDGRRALLALVRRYGDGYRVHLAAGICLTVLTVAVSQVMPYVLGVAIDALFTGAQPYSIRFLPDAWIPAERTGQFWFTLVLIVALSGAALLFGTAADFLWGNFAQHMQHEVRVDAYEAAQERDLSFYDDVQTGEVMSVLNNDVNKLENFFTQIVSMGIRVLVMTTGIALFMLWIHYQLAAVALVVLPVLFGVTRLFERRVSPKYEEKRSRVGKLNGRLENNVGGIQTIKSYSTEDEERERVRGSSAGYRDIAWSAFLERVGLIGAISGLTSVGYAVTFLVGGYWVLFGPPLFFTASLSVGTLVTFLLYSNRFQFPMYQFAGVLDGYQNARAAAARVVTLLEGESDVRTRPDADDLSVREGRVEYDGVTFSYEGNEESALDDVSFEAEPGSFVGLVGPTGAGKSTTMKLLPRLYDADEGAVRVDGQDVREVTLDSLRERVGYVSQEPYLFTGTVAENVAYGLDATHGEVVAAAKSAGAHEFVVDLDDGYDTEVGERGVKLSGGQKQRVALARALLKDPEILVLDEATSHVDNETEAVIQERLGDLTADRTTFAIAHRLSTVRDADTILVFDDGEIVERGSHEELLAADGLYANLWRVQVGDVEELPDSFLQRAHERMRAET